MSAPLTRQLAARLEELRRETGDHYAWQRTSLLKRQAASAGCEDSE
jgi:hypothetical protein